MKRFSMAMMGLALAGLMTMVSCRKPVVGFTNGESRTVTVSAVTESGGGPKTAIDGLNVKWSENDQIKMNAESVLTLTEGAGSTMGRFAGEVKGVGPYRIGYPAGKTTYDGETLKLNIPASWAYDADMKEIVPMVAYAASVDDDVQFHNAVNMLKLQLKGDDTDASKLTSIVLTSASSNLSGKISVTFDEGGNPTFKAIAGEGASKTMTVLFGDGLQLGETVQCVYIPLAKINGGDLTVRFDCANGRFMEKKVTADANFNGVNNMLSDELTVNTEGRFSVSATTKVDFAPGNLQYIGSTGTWKFAEHQWDYLGNNGQGSATNNVDRDLFGWGCTGSKDTRKDNHTKWYQTNYQPYSTSKPDPASGTDVYNKNRYGYGPDYVSSPYYNLTVENKSDWGCLAIGTDPADTWRTLSSAEWVYLLNTRSGQFAPEIGSSKDCRYAEVKVNGVRGMMVFPDVFAWPSDVENKPSKFNTYSSDWNNVNYLPADFGKLESAGVVFLPVAFRRSGESLETVNPYGYYWSSSCSSSQAAYCMYFSKSEVSYQASHKRYYGYSVRLVR